MKNIAQKFSLFNYTVMGEYNMTKCTWVCVNCGMEFFSRAACLECDHENYPTVDHWGNKLTFGKVNLRKKYLFYNQFSKRTILYIFKDLVREGKLRKSWKVSRMREVIIDETRKGYIATYPRHEHLINAYFKCVKTNDYEEKEYDRLYGLMKKHCSQ